MECNVGGMDRVIRIVAGIVLLVIGFVAPLPSQWALIAYSVALVALITAALGFCPANALLRINTNKR